MFYFSWQLTDERDLENKLVVLLEYDKFPFIKVMRGVFQSNLVHQQRCSVGRLARLGGRMRSISGRKYSVRSSIFT